MTSNGRDLGGYSVFFTTELEPVATAVEPEPEVPSPPPVESTAPPRHALPTEMEPVAEPEFDYDAQATYTEQSDAQATYTAQSYEEPEIAYPEPTYPGVTAPGTVAARPIASPPKLEAESSAGWSLSTWEVTPVSSHTVEVEPQVALPSVESETGESEAVVASVEVETRPAYAPHAAAEPEAEAAPPPTVHIVDRPADLISMEFATSAVLEQLSTAERVKPRSSQGMRGAMNKLGFRFGLSAAEQRAEERRHRIRTQVTAPHQIAVMSVKGGVGRTTATAALGSTFASIRADRVVAIDASGGFGDLATRTRAHPQGLNFQDLVRAQGLDSFAAVQAFACTNMADLDVVASPWTSAADSDLTAADYTYGFGTLRKHYNLLLADCGTGLTDPATIGVLSTSHAVLVVASATVGGVSGAVATLNWLFSHGLRHLVAKAVVALMHQRPDHPQVDVSEVENVFASARRPTVIIPFDAHLAEGGEIDVRLLRSETRLAFEELAVDMVAHFPTYREVMR